MELLHVSIFSGQCPKIQPGWKFFKGSLEITNPDGSSSLFGEIKNSFGKDSFTLHNGYLNDKHPHYLTNDMRQSETFEYFLLTIVSDGFIDISNSFTRKQGRVKIGPRRKRDKSMVLITLTLKKDQKFQFKIKNPQDQKTRDILILFNSVSNDLYVEDVTPTIVKPTLIMRSMGFLKTIFYKKPSVFGGL